MLQGQVIKAAGGFFGVLGEDGVEYLCRARGNLKRGQGALYVGDRVLFSGAPENSGAELPAGVVEKLLPRTNVLSRPPVANVDQLVVVMAYADPPCDWQLTSRIQVQAEKEGLAAILCLNKVDLAGEEEIARVQSLLNFYPYPVLHTSAVSGEGLEVFRAALSGVSSVFAGPSGVGKSSLLNASQPGLALRTGPVSEKIGRGRHTTRRAELLPLPGGGSVVDTPGFTRLDFNGISSTELGACFPEFDSLQGKCSFRNCRHLSEPACAVRGEAGREINPMRYEHYQFFMHELSRKEAKTP